jgi:hypothetical protein
MAIADLRRIPLFLAALCAALTVALELGSDWLTSAVPVTEAQVAQLVDAELARQDDADEIDRDALVAEMVAVQRASEPPGLALRSLALLDGILLLEALLLVCGLFLRERPQALLQVVAHGVFGLALILAGLVALLATLTLLLLMVSLFLAAPFGTLAYLASWGFFDRGGASLVLGALLLLKLGHGLGLFLAQPRFLRNKGVVLLVLSSLLANLVIAFLHGFVPLPVVSIADALAALVVLILGLIWAVVLFVFALVGLFKSLT